MRRHLRQNLILAAVVALLAAAVWFVVEREQTAKLAPLSDIVAERVVSLGVTAGDRPPRRFERRDGRWWMREPYAMPAHAEAVARLLAIAGAPLRSRHALDQFDLARIGLKPPQAVLELGDRRLEFGVTDAIRGDRYARNGDMVALVPDRFSAWLLAPPESELDHRLAAPLATLRSVRIDGQEHPALAAAWNQVTTSQVLAPENAPAAGSVIAVELTDTAGGHIDYTLWRRADGRYLALRREPALSYPLDEIQMQHLLPAAAAGAAAAVP